MQNLFKIEGEEDFLEGLRLIYSNEQWSVRRAFGYFCLAADKGHTEAIFQVGYWSIFCPSQILQNSSRAFECFKISAESGLLIAKCYLAECYFMGIGVQKDEKVAVELLEDSFKLGCSRAAYLLAHIYQYGFGSIEADSDKAKEYNNYARQANLPIAEIQYISLIMQRTS